jgi:hypothetical protein
MRLRCASGIRYEQDIGAERMRKAVLVARSAGLNIGLKLGFQEACQTRCPLTRLERFLHVRVLVISSASCGAAHAGTNAIDSRAWKHAAIAVGRTVYNWEGSSM